MKKFFSILFKILGVLFLGLLIYLLIGWTTAVKLPSDHTAIGHEQLASQDYMEVGDSARLLLQGIAKELQLPSLSTAISMDGEVIWAATFGYADIKKKKQPNLATRYRAGSVSKSMTGLLAAKLAQEGRLKLDASLYEYLPSYPKKEWDFTLFQLGAHTSGTRHYAGPGKSGFYAEQFSKHHYKSVSESLTVFEEDPLIFKPGTGFQYSTHGFTLLSAALEVAADQDFISLINDQIWIPSGMDNTRPDDLTMEDDNRIIPYTNMYGRLIHSEGPDPSYKWAGGGILTTPTDLVKMGQAFMNEKIVSPGTIDSLFKPISLNDGNPNPQGYALGWRNSDESDLLGLSDTIATMHHGGASPGGNSFLLLIPEKKISAAVMTNYSLRNSWPMRRAMYTLTGWLIEHKEIMAEKHHDEQPIENAGH